jgi:hypothetical protein
VRHGKAGAASVSGVVWRARVDADGPEGRMYWVEATRVRRLSNRPVYGYVWNRY